MLSAQTRRRLGPQPCVRMATSGVDGAMHSKLSVLVEARDDSIRIDYGARTNDKDVSAVW